MSLSQCTRGHLIPASWVRFRTIVQATFRPDGISP
ncbi:hypothetical protein RKD49_003499 [Streptomyces glaucescens]